MNKEIELTKDGGRFYRAMIFHYVFVGILFPFIVVLVIFAVLNPFWFRDTFFHWTENQVRKLALFRDKIKYRLYLGVDPEMWHALKD